MLMCAKFRYLDFLSSTGINGFKTGPNILLFLVYKKRYIFYLAINMLLKNVAPENREIITQ